MPVAVTPGKAVNSLEPSMRFFIMKGLKKMDVIRKLYHLPFKLLSMPDIWFPNVGDLKVSHTHTGIIWGVP